MATTRALTDHQQIREWAEARDAQPVAVDDTGDGPNDPGILRLDFPGYSGEGELTPISWDAWFKKFDAAGLTLLVQDTTEDGDVSNFNKLVKRETAAAAGTTRGAGRD